MTHSTVANVFLWERNIGAIAWDHANDIGIFEYTPAFLQRGQNIAPLFMPTDQSRATFSFPHLNYETYSGLPGLLADSLPDTFGNRLISAWLARRGRDERSFNPVERLCYVGKRGMGALEFKPAIKSDLDQSTDINISDLVSLARMIMSNKPDITGRIGHDSNETSETLMDILRVGTSAGGARPKAVIAMNENGDVKSGQLNVAKHYSHWILKFDGVNDIELGETTHFGRVEYAYYLMAKSAGVHMSECRLLEENDRAHFITKRFDRVEGQKIHMQTLCGLAHFDYNVSGAYSYEQVFQIMRQLHLSKSEQTQFYRRMVFNVIAKNLDDHTKNTSFLMTPDGTWSLSPAYDITYAHNPKGIWTNKHQMSISGKRENITKEDLLTLAKSVKIPHANRIIDDVLDAVNNWNRFAKDAGLKNDHIEAIRKQHGLVL